jgi:hypothetical protein
MVQKIEALNHPSADGLPERAKNMVAPYINNSRITPARARIRFMGNTPFIGTSIRESRSGVNGKYFIEILWVVFLQFTEKRNKV